MYTDTGQWIQTEHWGETQNASHRRGKEFFEKYLKQRTVIDIGCGLSPITHNATRYECDPTIDGNPEYDASYMHGIKNESYDVVYASHILEHCTVPYLAVRNWWRILKPNGFLIIAVPDRDLYELRTELPSRWNEQHIMFVLADREELPYTINLRKFIESCLMDKKYEIEYLEVFGEDVLDELPTNVYGVSEPGHPIPEYQIETVIRKVL